jgi:dTDP-4-dehydrorhamnose 3,5-epimerase
MSKPTFISGGVHTDERGTLSFVNDFDMEAVRRMYIIEHADTAVIRAWQGHRIEQKWFLALQGSFKIAVVRPDDWLQPSKGLAPEVFMLSADKRGVLHVPGGYATGFSAIEARSKMVVFSDATVEASQKDDYRFEADYWKF